jgi:hypothetical protein
MPGQTGHVMSCPPIRTRFNYLLLDPAVHSSPTLILHETHSSNHRRETS